MRGAISPAACWVRGLISNVKLMAGWKEASESLASNMQTTDGSHRLTSTSYRAWTSAVFPHQGDVILTNMA